MQMIFLMEPTIFWSLNNIFNGSFDNESSIFERITIALYELNASNTSHCASHWGAIIENLSRY